MPPLVRRVDPYEAIKEGIRSHAYPPGQKLSEARLAEQLGVGRSPVRTSLRRLEAEGWIEISPQSGSFVAEPSTSDVLELAELRRLLEAHAACEAATKLTDDELKMLREECDALKAIDLERDTDSLHAFDDIFHSTIHRAAGNKRITRMLRTLKDQIHWVRTFNTTVRPRRTSGSFAEMERVLEALERRNGEAAAALMAEHIQQIANTFVDISHGNQHMKRDR
ncbi:MAG TPA: GntR family transcriptional regulator [Afipia sp.]